MDSKFRYFVPIDNINIPFFLIQFLIQSIVACLCFWTEKASSIERLLFIPTLFLSGLLAPVNSFPEYVKSWIYLTPFPFLIDFLRIYSQVMKQILVRLEYTNTMDSFTFTSI